MKLILKSSGGFAGLQISGALDTAELAEELARRVEEHLTPEKLHAATAKSAAGKRSLPMPDVQQYHLSLLSEDEDGEAATYVVDDTCASDEILDLIDDLMAEITRRKRQAAAKPE